MAASDANEVASLEVSLPEMLDLALGTPEVGAINLNILHNFLHILLHQINLRSTKVEYRGDDANRIKNMVTSLKAGPSLYLHEYNITDGTNTTQRAHGTDEINVTVDVVMTEEDVTDDKASKAASDKDDAEKESKEEDVEFRKSRGVRQQIGPGAEGEYETVIYVEPIIDGVAPTALGFKRLEQSVNDLQQRFQALEELSTNPELIERLKGKITDPLTDVWQIINITKRLDASEQGIDKLTTMVQDVLKGDTSAMGSGMDTTEFEKRITSLEGALSNLDQAVKNLPATPAAAEGGAKQPAATGEEGGAKDAAHQTSQRGSLTQLPGGINIQEMHDDVAGLKKEVTQIRADLKGMGDKVGKGHKKKKKDKSYEEQETDGEEEGTEAKQTEVDQSKDTSRSEASKSSKQTDMDDMDDSDALVAINERLTKLEEDVWMLFEKVDKVQATAGTGNAELDELVSKIQGIQSEMDKLNQTADRLIDDRENREVHLNALLEQVELLKTIKADREDLEDALAEKADTQAINRKVSYDQFDAACDDLAQGLEDAINKLGKQETIWQEALDEVQREIEGKVDKIEMTPLKDFVSTRLKTLQEKLKNVAEMRQENEAAGSKKMLRDVQCISCDKNVVMKMEDTRKFKSEPLPCSMSMKPYLTYELDQVRKQHRRLPNSRNMIQFEAAMQEETRKQKSARTDTLVKTPRDHLCNRYCGGSHTVTTPQQRVMRMGHFLTQWGPEVVQLTEGMVKGTDGKMYKSRPMPGKFDVCGPVYCEDHGDHDQPISASKKGSNTSRKGKKGEIIQAHIEIEEHESDLE